MTPDAELLAAPPPHQRRRRDDATWIRVLREFGLPTVLAVGLFFAWDRSVREERHLSAAREERLTAVIDRLKSSIDASTDAARLSTAELRTVGERVSSLGDRVDRLEQLGARAMERRHRSPTPKETP